MTPLLVAARQMNHQSLLSPQEFELTVDAHKVGSPEFTIGYEVEVMPSAIGRVPLLAAADLELEPGEHYYDKPEVMACLGVLDSLGHSWNKYDGVYEVKSPVAQHPTSLALATRGLVRAGLIPAHAAELDVTSHVNIGTSALVQPGSETQYSLVRMLRAIEQLDGTDEQRLVGALKGELDDDYNWYKRGLAGVNLTVRQDEELDRDSQITDWQGDHNRVEFRSLSYKNPGQFGRDTIRRIYYLTRGLLSKDAAVAKVYSEYDDWLQHYQRQHNLQDISDPGHQQLCAIPDEKARRPERTKLLRAYLEPYAEHLKTADKTELGQKTEYTVIQLQRLFGMGDLPAMDDPDEFELALKAA